MIRPPRAASTIAATITGLSAAARTEPSGLDLAPGVLDQAGGAVALDRAQRRVLVLDVGVRGTTGSDDPLAVHEHTAVQGAGAVEAQHDAGGLLRVDAVDDAPVVACPAQGQRP